MPAKSLSLSIEFAGFIGVHYNLYVTIVFSTN